MQAECSDLARCPQAATAAQPCRTFWLPSSRNCLWWWLLTCELLLCSGEAGPRWCRDTVALCAFELMPEEDLVVLGSTPLKPSTDLSPCS